MSKIELEEIEEHRKRFRELCNKYSISVMPVQNNLPAQLDPMSKAESEMIQELNIDLSPRRKREVPRFELLE